MDVRVSWSPAALDDVDAIAECIHLVVAVVHGRRLLEPLLEQIGDA
jgi:plasmid stabilization system protein ParE